MKSRNLWVQLDRHSLKFWTNSSHFIFVCFCFPSVSTTHSDLLCEDVRPSLLSGGFQCRVHAHLDGRHRHGDRRTQSLLSSWWPDPWESAQTPADTITGMMKIQWCQSHTSVCYWDVSLPDCEHPLLATYPTYRTGFCHALHNNTTEEVEATVVQYNPAVNLRLPRLHDVSNLFTLASNSINYICPIVFLNEFVVVDKLSYLIWNSVRV